MDDRAEGQGFRQIGSLAKAGLPSPKSLASIGAQSSPSSGTIGLPSRETAASSSIGKRPGETAVAIWQDGAARRLTPSELDRKLLASLPRSVTSSLHERTVDRTTAEYGWDVEFAGYGIIEAPAHDVMAATALVERAMMPASPDLIKAELARLRVSTKSRAESPQDLALTAAAYAEYLRNYPADVVTDALRSWAAMEKWWPAWSELKELLDRRLRRRKALHAALKSAPTVTA